jgi:DegV family protein with EDD domain
MGHAYAVTSSLLTAENTAIVLDSTADFPDAERRHPNWRVVPLYVHLGDKSFRDWVELEPTEVYRRLRETGERPLTSQPSPGDFVTAFERLAEFARIICLVISSKLSGTHESATLAAEYDDRVVVIDSATMSAGTVLLAEALQRRLERGSTDAELLAVAERYREEARFFWTVESLEHLARGGRAGDAAGADARDGAAKPILELAGGEVVPRGQAADRAESLAELERLLLEETRDDAGLRVAVVHADAAEEAEALGARVRELRPAASLDRVAMFGAVLGTHVGPGGLGVCWYHDAP